MKKKNSTVKKINPRFYFNKLKNTKILNSYKIFKKNLSIYQPKKVCVAVSGGIDSLALVFFAKCLELEEKIKIYPCIVDHKLRANSQKEALLVKRKLKLFGIQCSILKNLKKISKSNIQSKARNYRYDLLNKYSKKKKINYILTGHHRYDLYENFFIRILRGSGLKGLSSISDYKSNIDSKQKIDILRPLLNIPKIDLKYVTENTFNFYINDPSNLNDNFTRVRMRKLINNLEKEGLDFKKFSKTLNNLNQSDKIISYYVKKNIFLNSTFSKKRKTYVLSSSFFQNPQEIVMRSINLILISFNNKKNYPRGKKVINLIKRLESSGNKIKFTLYGCIFEKIEKTVFIYKEK